MAQRDKQPLTPGAGDATSAEEVLNSVIQELDTLHQNVRGQLAEDITRLQTEKTTLIEDIDLLREQYRQLQSQQVETLSQRYIYQQQLWLKQLAQVLANNLQELLVQRFNELSANSFQEANTAIPSGEFPTPILANNYHDRASELLASLDASVNRTFDMMDRDLSSYESNLSQRLRNMEGMERKGEALLENLVNRLRVELEEEEAAQTFDPRDYEDTHTSNSVRPQPLTPAEPAVRQPPLPPAPPAPVPPKPASQVQVGVLLALLSAVVLSLFNVCLKIILKAKAPREIFGLFPVEGVVSPGFGNSLLILLIRLMVVMALMPILATFLYPSVWKDLRRFIDAGDRALWAKVLGSAFFLFLSQVFIYIAIGNIPTGVAITIFFIYPIVTVLASWGLFGDRPTVLRIIAMCVIVGGLLLAALPSFGQKAIGDVGLGVTAAVAAGVTFAGYVLLTQMAAGKLHPIPFSLVNFAAIFVFSAVSLIVLPLGIKGQLLPETLAAFVDPNVWDRLLFGGFILGVLTLFSYLLNNFAIRFAGAALASVIGTLGPALTALFALVIIHEKIPFIQVSGLALVTLGVAGMSLERMLMPKKAS